MTAEERQAVLTNLVQILNDNGGNRLTLSLVNGISVTHGQFLDTLLVAEKPVEAQNAASKRAKPQKE